MQTQFINLPTGRFAYHRTGGDLPPLVLAHGLTDSGLCWLRVAKVLEKHFDVVMLDARGHGQSERIGASNGEGPGKDIADAIIALDLHKPAVLGHSVGASAAASLANEFPQLVARLILEDPPFIARKTASEKAAQADSFRRQAQNIQAMSIPEIETWGRETNPQWHSDEIGPWAEAKKRVDANVVTHLDFSPWQQLVDRIEADTVLLYGENELGGMISPATADEASRLNNNIVPIQISGAGHNIHREQFGQFIDVVSEFLLQPTR